MIQLLLPGRESSATQMALDHHLLRSAGNTPLLRLYTMERTISFGLSQKAETVVDLALAFAKQIHLIRRPSGGEALLHDRGLTYALIVPKTCLPVALKESYRFLCQPLVEALRHFDPAVDFQCTKRQESTGGVCFLNHGIETVVLRGRKLCGSAQLRSRTHVMQHGEIYFGSQTIAAQELFLSLRNSQEYVSRVGFLLDSPQEDQRRQLEALLREGYEKLFGKSSCSLIESAILDRARQESARFTIGRNPHG